MNILKGVGLIALGSLGLRLLWGIFDGTWLHQPLTILLILKCLGVFWLGMFTLSLLFGGVVIMFTQESAYD